MSRQHAPREIDGELAFPCNVRVGEVTSGPDATPGYGLIIYFSGGPPAGTWDSDNSDQLWIGRYNVGPDESELHISIGDGDAVGPAGVAVDALVLGLTDSGTWYPKLRVQSNGVVIFTNNAEPADAELGNSQFCFWLDDTLGATKLMIKAKDSGGTVVAGEISLI